MPFPRRLTTNQTHFDIEEALLNASPQHRKHTSRKEKPTKKRNSNLVAELEGFFDDALIVGVPRLVKSGKEATVYCCQAAPSVGVAWVAAKIYRPRHSRNFKDDSLYREGRVILDSHERRAVQNKSRKGREVAFEMWRSHEFETLATLHANGADVPRPIAQTGSAVLMEYIGDGDAPAPQLCSVELTTAEAPRLFQQALRNIELWLACSWVHGDLSEYNILYWQGKLKIIDFPQAVDARTNRHALDLLARDIENITRFFEAFGVRADPYRIAQSFWGRYKRAEL